MKSACDAVSRVTCWWIEAMGGVECGGSWSPFIAHHPRGAAPAGTYDGDHSARAALVRTYRSISTPHLEASAGAAYHAGGAWRRRTATQRLHDALSRSGTCARSNKCFVFGRRALGTEVDATSSPSRR